MIFLPLKIKMKEIIRKYGLWQLALKATVLISFILLTHISNAQTLEIGGFGGTSYYLGELNPALPYNQTQLAYGALARYNLNSRWAIKFSYYRGKVKGSDITGSSTMDRDLDFISNSFTIVSTNNDISASTSSLGLLQFSVEKV